MKSKEHLVEIAGSARTLLANQEIIFPMLKQKEEEAIAAMIHEFKKTGQVHLGHVATISSLRDMRTDLELQARRGEKAMAVLHQGED